MVHHLEHLTFRFHVRLLTVTFQPRAVTGELPNNYPFIVQRGYIIDTVSQWDDPTKTLFDFTVKKLKEVTSSVVDTHFELCSRQSETASFVSRTLLQRIRLVKQRASLAG